MFRHLTPDSGNTVQVIYTKFTHDYKQLIVSYWDKHDAFVIIIVQTTADFQIPFQNE